jgi:ribosomal-protein-alanine N-acetyltransferase
MQLIETERLLLRPYVWEDLPALTVLLADPTTMRFWPRLFTPDEAQGWLERAMTASSSTIYGRRALVLKSSGEQIGDVGVVRATLLGEERNDLGYIVDRRWWGQGFASEAAQALCDHYLHEHGLDALVANMAWDNLPSQRVAEKIGMRKVAEFNNPRNRDLLTFLYEIRLLSEL